LEGTVQDLSLKAQIIGYVQKEAHDKEKTGEKRQAKILHFLFREQEKTLVVLNTLQGVPKQFAFLSKFSTRETHDACCSYRDIRSSETISNQLCKARKD